MPLPSLTKQPSENRLYLMDFSPNLATNETIASVSSVVASPVGLTLVGPPTFNGAGAYQQISGGTSGITYKVTFLVLTTLGNTLEGEGNLVVRNI